VRAHAYHDGVQQCLAGLLILMTMSACGGPTQSPATPAPVSSFVEPPPEPVPSWCLTAQCMRTLAAEAEAGGVRDAAVAWLGAAYRLEPRDEAFARWLDALAQTGQHRRLAQALAEAKAAGLHVEQLARHEGVAAPQDAALQSGPATADIHEAMQAELAGRLDDAIAGLAGAAEPVDLTHRGDLLWARGDWVAAREAWAAARIAIDERGGSMRLTPVERWRTSDLFWIGDSLVLVHTWTPVPHEENFWVTELRQWSVEDPPGLLRSLVLPEWAAQVRPSIDGRRLYALTPTGVDVLDFVDGHRVARLPLEVGDRTEFHINRDETHVLVRVGRAMELWSLAGELLERFELDGTTPTITRVYTGQGSHHDNILRDSPTWPVSSAMTNDLRWVAIGGSDSKVRLFDRKTGKHRVLEYKWVYEEWRHGGSNPDLNLPLDLRFAGDELVVIYRHGDLIRWRVHDGKPVRHFARACSKESVQWPDDCHVEDAKLSDDASRVVTGGSYGITTHVRDTSTDQTLATLTDQQLTTDHIAFADDGRVAFANTYGRPQIWSGTGDVLIAPWGLEHSESGPLSPSLSADGRYLSWLQKLETGIVWDLEQRRQLVLPIGEGERVASMADDGTRYAVDTGKGLALRRRDGVVEHRGDNRVARVEWFASDGHLAVLHRHEGADQFIDFSRDHVVNLQSSDHDDGRVHAVDAAGTHVLRLTDNMIELFDGASGKRTSARAANSIEAIAIAPDASWFAWLEKVRDESDGPTAVAHLLPLVRGGRLRTLSVPGWAKQLVVSPGGDELLVVSEDALTRWNVTTDEREPIDLDGWMWANDIRYSADGRWLFFAGYDRVTIRANSGRLAVVAIVHSLLDGSWMVMANSGAVDGNARAWEQLATVVDGPIDSVVLGGGLGWDRFAVAGLLGFVLAGQEVQPPLAASPRPVVEDE
jgi:WD40 repeat protein